jgi:hypothetical protein
MNRVSAVVAGAVAGLALVSVPSPASAQATRTWVSGVGDDANPCSRTAPCKTFPGAISKTATGGEIDVLDPGGFGGVTITKSITIDGGGFVGSSLVSGTNAIIINGTSTSVVILRNMQVTGVNVTSGTSNGVRVLAAKSVTLQNVDISGMNGCGVCVEATSPTKVRINNTRITNNTGAGVRESASSGVGNRVVVSNSTITGNGGAGIHVIAASGTTFSYGFAFHNVIADNQDGILDDGATSNTRISDNDIVSNGTGLRTLNSGKITSFQDNRVSANGTDGVPTGTLTAK